MSKNVQERLAAAQERLHAEGVRDIKFYVDFSPDTPAIEVASEVADVLEAEAAGRFRQVASFKELLNS